jgi:hypothetical protein
MNTQQNLTSHSVIRGAGGTIALAAAAFNTAINTAVLAGNIPHTLQVVASGSPEVNAVVGLPVAAKRVPKLVGAELVSGAMTGASSIAVAINTALTAKRGIILCSFYESSGAIMYTLIGYTKK